jgi:hypothetical protein
VAVEQGQYANVRRVASTLCGTQPEPAVEQKLRLEPSNAMRQNLSCWRQRRTTRLMRRHAKSKYFVSTDSSHRLDCLLGLSSEEIRIPCDKLLNPNFDKRISAAAHIPPAENADSKRSERIDDEIPHRIRQPGRIN